MYQTDQGGLTGLTENVLRRLGRRDEPLSHESACLYAAWYPKTVSIMTLFTAPHWRATAETNDRAFFAELGQC